MENLICFTYINLSHASHHNSCDMDAFPALAGKTIIIGAPCKRGAVVEEDVEISWSLLCEKNTRRGQETIGQLKAHPQEKGRGLHLRPRGATRRRR